MNSLSRAAITYQPFRSKYYIITAKDNAHWPGVADDEASQVYARELINGLMTTLQCFFKEPVTINYPFEKGPLSPRFRGEHALRR